MKNTFIILGVFAVLGLVIIGQLKVVQDCGWQSMFVKDAPTYWLLGGCK